MIKESLLKAVLEKELVRIFNENKRLQAELDKLRFIPIGEKLPETSAEVLATDGLRYVVKNCGEWIKVKLPKVTKITHWRPIISSDSNSEGQKEKVEK